MMYSEWENSNITWHYSDIKYNETTKSLTKWENIEENDTNKND